MSSIAYIKGNQEGQSTEALKQYYDRIPAEKKPYLTSLGTSVGPWLATERGEYIFDAASQIATLGLGFNHPALFGTGHFLESWLNRPDTKHFQRLREGYRRFFKHRLLWDSCSMFLCNSGAEAIETALGDAFQRRKNKKQTKVLAFEGSFHGRFLISLSSTWNPVKRELFEWPDFKTSFVPFPHMKSDYRSQPKVDKDWAKLWQESARVDFEAIIPKTKNALLQSEIDSLLEVRRQLMTGEIFAIVAEPMQCEGGDRYSSFGFQNALANMARVFQVPLIYDEVQTGFAMGGSFFWHRLFDLKDASGQAIHPDYVVCAKKAQVGIVLSRNEISFQESFSVASVIRGYNQAITLDQSRAHIAQLEKVARTELRKFVAKFPRLLESPRSQGLAFSVDFKDPKLLPKFVGARFNHGLLFYPAGSNTARFRMNIAWKGPDVQFLFKMLENCMNEVLGKPTKKVKDPLIHRNSKPWEKYQQQLIEAKLKGGSSAEKAMKELFESIRPQGDVKVKVLNPRTYRAYRTKVQKLQKVVYEPARQTPIFRFDNTMKSKDPIAIVLEKGKELVGITFLGTLQSFPFVRGARNDPEFYTPKVLYSVDVTVHPKFQGAGFGRFLRVAAYAIALKKGIKEIHGRNRDQVAAAMTKINLSLGTYELQHLTEDYPDEGEFRCCFYYSNPVKWDWPKLSLSSGIQAPLSEERLSLDFIKKETPVVVNKVCLSNFVSRDFMDRLRGFLDLVPKELRQAYTTSGQSECVEKIIKSIWGKRKIQRVLTFDGCFFGDGSFMSRTLSGTADFFPVTRLPFPNDENADWVLQKLKKALSENEYHSIWIEPLTQRTFERVSNNFLTKLRDAAGDTPIVSNDTASLFHRFSKDHFVASGAFVPDAAFSFLGGQLGVCYLNREYFVEQPLAMISTWDGDEFSMAQFSEALAQFQENRGSVFDQRAQFQTELEKTLEKYRAETRLRGGFGTFSGAIPESLSQCFRKNHLGDYLVCPTDDAMKTFLEGIDG